MSVRKRWLDFRERLLTSQDFHRFALKFPLTRPIVRKRQSELFDLVSGFVYSQVLQAVVELDLLVHLKGEGQTLSEISQICDLNEDASRRLCDAAVSMRVFEKLGDRYRLGDLGSALAANPGVIAMIAHHRQFYEDMVDPVARLRAGPGNSKLSQYWDYALSDDPTKAGGDKVAPYSRLMAESQAMVAEEAVASFDFSASQRLMDVGGGLGAFISRVSKAAPTLELGIFDLPAVVEKARDALAINGLADRTQFHGGDFFKDELPDGYDLISLVRILHDHDDQPVRVLLKNIYTALQSGGTLLVCEPMSGGGQAARISDAYFNFYLHAMGTGRPRTPDELIEMIEEAGFRWARYERGRAPLITSLIVAQK